MPLGSRTCWVSVSPQVDDSFFVPQVLGIHTANWCSQSLPVNKASFSRGDLDLRFGWSNGHVLNSLERFLCFFHFNLRWAVAPNRSLLRTSLERMLRLEIGRPPLLNREILCWPAITSYGFFKPRPKMRSNQTEVIENGNGNCTDLKMCFLLKMVIF